MIELFTWKTPSGHKVSIMLKECAMDYHMHLVDLTKGDQYNMSFLKLSPSSSVPAIIDRDAEGGPLSIFEADAILIYLADKAGRFLPRPPHARSKVMEWLLFESAELSPIFTQTYHFIRSSPEPIPHAITHYVNESLRLLRVLEAQFKQRAFIAGDYSIADIALYPWVDAIIPLLENNGRQEEVENLFHMHRWHAQLSNRPAIKQGMNIPVEYSNAEAMLEEA